MDTQLFDGMVAFAEVVDGGGFSKAADKLGHSSSYISKEINKLEERLKTRLLHRTTRTLRLTPEGELYYERAKNLISEMDELKNQLLGNDENPSGLLRISCPISFGLSRLRPHISRFTDQFPDVTLELDLSDRKVDLIADGYDVAIRASAKLEDSSLISRRFLQSKGIILASPEYLNKHGFPTHPSELSDHKTISYSYLKQPRLWQFIDAEGNETQIELSPKVITNSPEMELELCKAGQGITRLPLFNLGNELETGELVELFKDYPSVPIDVYLVYPSRKHLSAKVRAFIDFIVAAF